MKLCVLLLVALVATAMARPDGKRSPAAVHMKQVQAKRLAQEHQAAEKRALVKTVKELLEKMEKKDEQMEPTAQPEFWEATMNPAEIECNWEVDVYTCAAFGGGDICINKDWICDNYQDCEDNSDEEGCDAMGSGSGSGMDINDMKRNMKKALSQKKKQETKEVLPQMKRNATALTGHLNKKEKTRRTLMALLKTIV